MNLVRGLRRAIGRPRRPSRVSYDELADRVAALEASLDRHFDAKRGLGASVMQIQSSLDAILRRLALEGSEVAYPHRLTAQRFRYLSQNGEDGMVLALLQAARVQHRTFAEIGSGVNGGNSGFLAEELGWSGLMVDGSEERIDAVRRRFHRDRVHATAAWVTCENINDLLRNAGLEGEIDLLSIDIDGNDIWVWQAIEQVSARVVVIEFNQLYGPADTVAVPYDPRFDRHDRKALYFGASLPAMVRMGERLGHRLVAVEPRGVNAFFVRNDLASEVPTVTCEEATPREEDRAGSVQAYAEREGLPLVVVP